MNDDEKNMITELDNYSIDFCIENNLLFKTVNFSNVKYISNIGYVRIINKDKKVYGRTVNQTGFHGCNYRL